MFFRSYRQRCAAHKYKVEVVSYHNMGHCAAILD